MAKPAVRMVGTRRHGRAVLLRTTALQATACLVISLPVAAQPAASARPQGGQVTAGAAKIVATPNTTTITQSSNRAAIDWTRFDVGSAQSVAFNQPSSAAVTLNRVTGPDPSAIAGKITANGQIVITNPSGVVFYQGAEVNAQSVVVSAAGITNQNFMAGRMAFDQPANPGARIDNRGTITVKQAGLAALVAPSVANSGVINARLGQVVLAGAQTHTLDLYGDGLVSIDVTGQVRQAQAGPDGKPVTALVTNTGVIRADGGVVQLTAAAADGVVQTLVDAGGRVQARSTAGRAGRIEITGTGGAVVVEGRVAADGRIAGSTGGQVEIRGDTATTIASGAHVSASGHAGGGTVAIGTTLARAVTTGAAVPGTSARTTIAVGARVAADATGHGTGGRVTVLSTQNTQIAGTLTARGGRRGGDGGMIEMSGERGFTLTGTADTSAPHGALGTILLDPTDLTIVGNGQGETFTPPNNVDPNIAYTDDVGSNIAVREATIEALTGNIHLQATNNLTVSAPLTLGTQNLTLDAGNTLTIGAGFTVQTGGRITLNAGTLGTSPAGGVSIQGTIRSTGSNTENIVLDAGTSGISIGGVVDAGGRLGVSTTGPLTGGGQVIATDLVGSAASVNLTSTANQIASVGGLINFSTTGSFTLTDSGTLTIPAGSTLQTGGVISLTAGTAGALNILGTLQDTGLNTVNVALTAGTGGINVGGVVNAGGRLSVTTTGAFAEQGTGQVVASDLVGSAASVSLQSQTNQVAQVGTFNPNFTTISGDFVLVDHVALTEGIFSPGGGITVPSGHAITLVTDSLTVNTNGPMLRAPGGTITIAPYTPGTTVELTSSGTKTAGALSLTITELSGMQAATLQLGQLDASLNPTAGAVTIGKTGDSTSIDLGAAGFTTLALYASGAVSQTVALGVTTVQGQAGSLALTNVSNFPSTLNGFTTTTGDLAFHTGGSLSVTGALLAQGGANVSLSSAAGTPNVATLTLGAAVTGGTVSLNSLNGSASASGGISQTGGIITATTLTGAGYFAQLGQANQIAQLSDFTTYAGLSLTSAHALSLIGAIVSQSGSVTLNAPGITQLSTSSLTTTELDGASSADVLLTSRANQVSGINNFTMTGGNFTLVTASPALVFDPGTVEAGAGSLTFIADGVGQVGSAGSIHAPSGTVTFAPFTASRPMQLVGASARSVGTLSIGQGLINTLTVGTLALGNGTATGAITLGNAGDTISLRGHAGVLDLVTSGAVSQGSGAILDVATLAGQTGSVALPGANTIDALGAYTVAAGGSFSVNDAAALAITSPVNGGATATITSAAGLTVGAGVSAVSSLVLKANGGDVLQTAGVIQTTGAGSSLELDASGAVRQTGGSIATPGSLTGSAGSAALTSAANSVPTLQAYTTTGAFTLVDAGSLLLLGGINSRGAVNLQITGALTIDSSVTGTAGTLTVGGAVTQNGGGGLTLTSLAGSAGSLTLNQAQNYIATLGNFTTSGGFDLTTGASFFANRLTVSGTVTDPATIHLTNYGPLTLSGTVQAPGVSIAADSTTNALASTPYNTDGTITQTGGSVIANPGGGFTTGTITMVAGDAFSQSAGAITATGPSSQVSITSHGALSLGGAVTADTISLSATTRSIPVNYGQNTETNPGVVSQTGGVLTGGVAVQTDSSASLASPTNAVSTLGTVATVGAFTLVDGVPLTIGSPVSSPVSATITAPSLVGTADITAPLITLTASAGGLNQTAGTISASSTLTLNATGAISGSGGRIVTGALAGTFGTLSLLQPTNAIASIGNLTGGATTLVNGGGLVVSGPVTLGATAITLGGSGDLNIIASSLTTGALSLQLGGGVRTSSGGAITATSLTGAATLVSLGNARIASLLDFTSAGDFSVANQGPLTLAGTVSASSIEISSADLPGPPPVFGTITQTAGTLSAGSITIQSGDGFVQTAGTVSSAGGLAVSTQGAITLGGTLSGTLSLIATDKAYTDSSGHAATRFGTVTQTGGAIIAGQLSGTADSFALPQTTNAVGTVGAITTPGAFQLVDDQALTIAGPVAAGDTTLGVTAGDLTVTGSLHVRDLALAVAGHALPSGAGSIVVSGVLSGTAGALQFGTGVSVATLGSFTSSTGLTLTDAGTLAVTGPVTDATRIALQGSGLTLAGALTAPTVSLVSTSPGGGISHSGGAITTSVLTGTSAGAVSLGGANAITTLGSFTSVGGFALTNPGALSLTGPLTDTTSVSLTTGALALGGVVTAPVLVLASGAVTQPGGHLAVGTLLGSAASVALGQRGNSVGALGAFASAGDFSLVDSAALSVGAAVSVGSGHTLTLVDDAPRFAEGSLAAPGGTVALQEYTAGQGVTLGATGTPPPITAATLAIGAATGGPVTITGPFNLSAVGVLNLLSGGAITETGAGALQVGALAGSGASASLNGANQIGSLAAFTTTGAFSLADGQGLTVTGPVVAGTTASLNVTGDLALAGSVTAPGLALTATGAISQTAGVLTTANLSGSSASASFGDANQIATLGPFTTTGDFTLYDGRSLTVSGAVDPNTVTMNVTGDLTLTSSVTGTTVNLVATGTITEGVGGSVNAGTLTATANSAALTGSNAVATLGAVTTQAGFSLVDGSALTVAGPVGDAANVSLQAPGLTLAGALTAPTVSLVSTSPGGGISQNGGAITAGVLTGTSAGAVSLAGANAITTLGSFASVGGFALTNLGALSLSGPLTDTTSVSLTTGALALNGVVTAPALVLASGAVTQPGGHLAVGTLLGSAASVALGQRGNSVGALGAFASAGDFNLVDSAALSVGAAVSVGTGHTLTLTNDAPSFATGGSLSAPGGTVALQEYTAGQGVTLGATGTPPPITASTLAIGAATGGPVTITGAFNLSAVGVLDLLSSGAISETGAGALQVGALAGSGASASLNGANQIGTLAGFTTTGAFSLADGQAVTVTGPLVAGTTASLNVTGAVALAGSVTAPGLALTATGAISQTAGILTTSSLSGSSASASLGDANQIGTLAGFATTGGFSLTDAQGLTVAGPLAAGSTSLNVTGNLALAASMTGTTVNLVATGALTEATGGAITAGTLTTTANSAALTGGNAVATLGGATTQAGFTLVDATALTVAGSVTDATSISLQSAGLLTLAGTIAAPTVVLASTGTGGSISQTAGALTASTLTSNAVGQVVLNGAGNVVGTLGNVSGSGGFALTDAGALAVAGPVTDTTGVSLTAAGALTLNGTLTTPVLTLAAGGAIAQPGGALAVGTLRGSATSTALTQAGNSVAALGVFTSSGDFTLVDGAAALTVGGAVSVGSGHTLTLTTNAPRLDTNSALTAPGGTVVLQEYTAGQALDLSGVATTLPITATTLVLGNAQAGAFSIPVAFDLSSVSVLDLLSGGAITETGAGSLRVATLEGSSASATLGGANRITTLAGFTTTGAFGLTDAQGLTVASPVAASTTASLAVTGDLALAASITAPTSLVLTVSGTIGQGAGTITTANLSGQAASANFGDANQIATLGPFTTTGDFTLFDGRSLTVTGPVDPNTVTMNVTGDLALNNSVTGTTVDLTATGAITEGPGGSINAGTLTLMAHSVALGGSNAVATLGSATSQTGFALVDGTGLTVAGPVSDGTSIALQSTGALTLAGALGAPTVSLVAGGGITQASGIITAGTLTGSAAGAVGLASANAIGTLGRFVSAGFSLTDGVPLTIAGPLTDSVGVSLTTGALVLNGVVSAPTLTLASGVVTQPGGYLAVGTLSGTATSAALGQPGNSVGALGAFTSTGDFTLVDGTPLTIAAPVTVGAGRTLTLDDDAASFAVGGAFSAPGGAVVLQEHTAGQGVTLGAAGTAPITGATLTIGSLTGGPVTITGAFDLSGVGLLDLLSAGAITETGAGALRTSTLAGAGASANLTGANRIATLLGFTTPGAFALTDIQGLTVTGPLSTGSASLNVTGDLAVVGNITALAGLALTATGAVNQSAGTLTTARLSGQAASASLANPNQIASLGPFTTTGSFNMSNARNLSLAGPLIAGTASLSVTGDLALAADITAQAVTLVATGAITQSAGTITTARLNGHAAAASFGTASIGTLADFVATGAFALTNTGPLTVTTPVTAENVMLSATGALTLAAPITATTVTLSTQGALTQTAGTIQATTLGGNAASVNLNAANGITTLAGFTTQGAFTLTDTQAVSVTGPFAAGSLTLTAPGVILAGPLTAGSLTVNTPGSLVQTGGPVRLGTLGGTVGQGVDLGTGGALALSQLGSLSAASGLALVDGTGLTLSGALSAPYIAVSATGSMTLAGGSITTTGLPPAQESGATPTAPGSFLQVLAGTDGRGQFAQTGTTTVQPLSNAASTLRIGLPAGGGSLTLAGLQAPQTTIILSLGSGTASGALSAGDLLVLGTGGTAALTGSVRTLTGFNAAQVSRINPVVSQGYKLNGCAIASTNCVPFGAVLTPFTTLLAGFGGGTDNGTGTASGTGATRSILRPDILTLDVLDLSVTRDRDDPTLLLPNISDRDY